MANKTGIRQNVIQKVISGCKVAFDPRTTAEVCNTRDEINYKAREQGFRRELWLERQHDKRAKQAAA